jgi:hypothetical protein
LTSHDDWLIEKAREKSQRVTKARQHAEREMETAARRRRIFNEQVTELWNGLEKELQRQATLYNDALQEPHSVRVEHYPNYIAVRTREGREVAVTLQRDTMSVHTVTTDMRGFAGGGLNARFVFPDESSLEFGVGPASEMAASMLRDLLN